MKTSNRNSFRPAAVVLPLLLLLLTAGAVTARADGYTRTLSAETAVPGYVDYDATLYNFQTNTPAVLPTSGDLRYREGGNWGLHNFGSGTRSATVTIPVREGNILILQHYDDVYATLDRGTLNEELSGETGYQCYDITETANDITITIARYGGIVAAVVLNRVASASFPNTISGVIYQSGAFSCVSNGQINNTPDATAIRAALDALNGWDPTGGCLYYYNPKATGDQWIRTRTVKTVIGNHSFAV